jgi:hypothetical protein
LEAPAAVPLPAKPGNALENTGRAALAHRLLLLRGVRPLSEADPKANGATPCRTVDDRFNFCAGWQLVGTLVALPTVGASGLFGTAFAIYFMAQAASAIRRR